MTYGCLACRILLLYEGFSFSCWATLLVIKQTKRPIFNSVAGFAVNGKPFATELKNGCRIVQRTRLHRHFPLAFTSLCVHVHIALCLLVEINSLSPGSGLDPIERTLDKAGGLGTIELTTVYKYQYGRSLLGRLYKTTSTKVAKRLAGV